jgi:hypothetical protein
MPVKASSAACRLTMSSLRLASRNLVQLCCGAPLTLHLAHRDRPACMFTQVWRTGTGQACSQRHLHKQARRAADGGGATEPGAAAHMRSQLPCFVRDQPCLRPCEASYPLQRAPLCTAFSQTWFTDWTHCGLPEALRGLELLCVLGRVDHELLGHAPAQHACAAHAALRRQTARRTFYVAMLAP